MCRSGWAIANVKLLGSGFAVGGPDRSQGAGEPSRAGGGRSIAIVESLDLSEIEAGTYHFSALPLAINGGDAAPVRAILWRD